MNAADRTTTATYDADPDKDYDYGPACGTPEAAVCLNVTYFSRDDLHNLQHVFCCCRHVPASGELLPKDALIIEVALTDVDHVTSVFNGDANVTFRQ